MQAASSAAPQPLGISTHRSLSRQQSGDTNRSGSASQQLQQLPAPHPAQDLQAADDYSPSHPTLEPSATRDSYTDAGAVSEGHEGRHKEKVAGQDSGDHIPTESAQAASPSPTHPASAQNGSVADTVSESPLAAIEPAARAAASVAAGAATGTEDSAIPDAEERSGGMLYPAATSASNLNLMDEPQVAAAAASLFTAGLDAVPFLDQMAMLRRRAALEHHRLSKGTSAAAYMRKAPGTWLP